MRANASWVADNLRNRNIGDFLRWKDRDAHRKAFDWLLRDLKAKTEWTTEATGRLRRRGGGKWARPLRPTSPRIDLLDFRLPDSSASFADSGSLSRLPTAEPSGWSWPREAK